MKTKTIDRCVAGLLAVLAAAAFTTSCRKKAPEATPASASKEEKAPAPAAKEEKAAESAEKPEAKAEKSGS